VSLCLVVVSALVEEACLQMFPDVFSDQVDVENFNHQFLSLFFYFQDHDYRLCLFVRHVLNLS